MWWWWFRLLAAGLGIERSHFIAQQLYLSLQRHNLLLLTDQSFIQFMDNLFLKGQLHFQVGKPFINHGFKTLDIVPQVNPSLAKLMQKLPNISTAP
jgi:hypothetical protein